MVDFYGYKKCSTCRKAEQWLSERGVEYRFVDITETPPGKGTLKQVLRDGGYELRHLFNTSGQQYRELKIKERLPAMGEGEALDLLAGNGKLVKRPIVTDGGSRHTVGFKPEVFERVWGEPF